MITKTKIRESVLFLLESARKRETSQGILVFTKILEMIDAAQDDNAIVDVLGKLNCSLAGMEAHGHFSDEEFERVLMLRKAEGKFC